MRDLYKNLKESGRWYKMTLAEQLGNVGSDVDRIISWRKKGNEEYATNAFYRALDLLDLTISGQRWHGARLKELCRVREILCDSFFGSLLYNTTLEYFSKYFYQFALIARKSK
ncbi:MAG: hypothetical protein A3I68_04910 [Candidatus Melainabacteria bacterium RIFCSPLOWO2_02_FULL_35_15]|nr:MAG: hypothetical protein A3F80_07130 [Candidatus Melainabacteria bacterium RIFCSPLOWO2_12_FULL_35_11]OGI12796.1 MAG: hypothetical protein A3I68_04910 [Candidatus Melainabacteria bacterium RIFCSPLOWO2_02_FULL_35_15]